MANYFSEEVARRGLSSEWEQSIEQAAWEQNISRALIKGIIAAESAWVEDAISPDGSSIGLMQINLVHGYPMSLLLDGHLNLDIGAKIIRAQLDKRQYDLALSLAGYNAGTNRSDADLAARIAADTNGVGRYVETVTMFRSWYLDNDPDPVPPPGGGGVDVIPSRATAVETSSPPSAPSS